jgi:hypothetical protein
VDAYIQKLSESEGGIQGAADELLKTIEGADVNALDKGTRDWLGKNSAMVVQLATERSKGSSQAAQNIANQNIKFKSLTSEYEAKKKELAAARAAEGKAGGTAESVAERERAVKAYNIAAANLEVVAPGATAKDAGETLTQINDVVKSFMNSMIKGIQDVIATLGGNNTRNKGNEVNTRPEPDK